MTRVIGDQDLNFDHRSALFGLIEELGLKSEPSSEPNKDSIIGVTDNSDRIEFTFNHFGRIYRVKPLMTPTGVSN
jgi:hypothetical protein